MSSTFFWRIIRFGTSLVGAITYYNVIRRIYSCPGNMFFDLKLWKYRLNFTTKVWKRHCIRSIFFVWPTLSVVKVFIKKICWFYYNAFRRRLLNSTVVPLTKHVLVRHILIGCCGNEIHIYHVQRAGNSIYEPCGIHVSLQIVSTQHDNKEILRPEPNHSWLFLTMISLSRYDHLKQKHPSARAF